MTKMEKRKSTSDNDVVQQLVSIFSEEPNVPREQPDQLCTGSRALTPLAPFREQTCSLQLRPRKWIPSKRSSTLFGSPRTVRTARTHVWHSRVCWPGLWAAELASNTGFLPVPECPWHVDTLSMEARDHLKTCIWTSTKVIPSVTF